MWSKALYPWEKSKKQVITEFDPHLIGTNICPKGETGNTSDKITCHSEKGKIPTTPPMLILGETYASGKGARGLLIPNPRLK